MSANRIIHTFRRLREQPLWRLLAADHGPAILGILQSQLFNNEKSLPASVFHERVERDLEELRAGGEELPQTAQAYIAGCSIVIFESKLWILKAVVDMFLMHFFLVLI